MEQNLTVLCDVSSRGRLQIKGEDRIRFLNGQITNNLKTLSCSSGCFTFLTNARGKIRNTAVILNTGESFLMDLEEGQDVSVSTDLERYIIADDVTVENISSSWRACTLIGEDSAEILTSVFPKSLLPSSLFNLSELSIDSIASLLVHRSHRSILPSYDLWIKAVEFNPIFDELSQMVSLKKGKIGSPTDLETLRIEAGIPKFRVDMDENTLAPESGLESMAISYSKGCYVGQEVISRIKNIGHVNRLLVRFHSERLLQKGEKLSEGEKEAGFITSAAYSPRFGNVGLAMVKREFSSVGTLLFSSNSKVEVIPPFHIVPA